MQYDAQTYTAVNGTLYRYFAIVGGTYQLGSIIAAAVLAWLVRKRRPPHGWTLAVVAPVNSVVGEALRSAPDSVPALWMQLRYRWEYGHAAGFAVQLIGFAALLISLLVETRPTSP